MMKQRFIAALQNHSLSDLQMIDKSDLHNHAGRGGHIEYIEQWANVKIMPPTEPFHSLDDMQHWFDHHVKCHCPGLEGYLKRIEASFAQARQDHIKVLSMSFGIDEIDKLGGMDPFINIVNGMRDTFSPDTAFFPELALTRESCIDSILHRIDEILSYQWFKSIDICNNEFAQPIKHFKGVYQIAQKAGLIRKAHVGEFGSADDVMEAVEELELQEVHHGVAAAQSPQIMKWLANHNIQLNVCPTSNVMLRVASSYKEHPIRTLLDNNVPVSINTDDLLIFNSTISQEYLHLYEADLMTADELNLIRENGLHYAYKEGLY